MGIKKSHSTYYWCSKLFKILIMEELNKISYEIIGCAYSVHRNMGQGLLETVYEICFGYELSKKNLHFRRQVTMPVEYEGLFLESGYRIDLLVEEKIIVEVKSVDKILPVHKAQLMTYLKLAKMKLGLLINFNVPNLQDGIVRIVY